MSNPTPPPKPTAHIKRGFKPEPQTESKPSPKAAPVKKPFKPEAHLTQKPFRDLKNKLS